MSTSSQPELPDLYEAGVVQLQTDDYQLLKNLPFEAQAYLARIEEVNLKGAELRAVLEVSPRALEVAAQLDEERRANGRGACCMEPYTPKARHCLNTTAGSHALLGALVPEDAGVVKRLRQAGAIILGKANMSEMAHFRGEVPSGWSGRGGQCKSAYHPIGSPSGSSSGSGVAASIASFNNVVGIKPTVGLTSRARVLPITAAQDTVGPMTRSVEDAAIVLSIIAGEDPNDGRTLSQPRPVPDYTKALNINALQGKRIGVPRSSLPSGGLTLPQSICTVFDESLQIFESLGATIVDPANLPSAEEIRELHNTVLYTDFKIELQEYLASLTDVPSGVRTLADLIQFNIDNPELELPEGATRGIDKVLKEFELDALVLPAKSTHTPAALAGYPIVTVPLGFLPDDEPIIYDRGNVNVAFPAPGMPFGISFIGTAFDEYALIGMALRF
ncbi:amidase signature enzyme [Gymnopus androsaceus JB14]|uniref:Amidase signature enzyme n=1 Tax=Gymnopus androsaceus JB14 TaxID=1447944 RepID=A0A6A4HED6_9AGAR|nr:amidase signature enzyme [Gymnopus androsaceus JB14]